MYIESTFFFKENTFFLNNYWKNMKEIQIYLNYQIM